MNAKELCRALNKLPPTYTVVFHDAETGSIEEVGKLTLCDKGDTVLLEAPIKMDEEPPTTKQIAESEATEAKAG